MGIGTGVKRNTELYKIDLVCGAFENKELTESMALDVYLLNFSFPFALVLYYVMNMAFATKANFFRSGEITDRGKNIQVDTPVYRSFG